MPDPAFGTCTIPVVVWRIADGAAGLSWPLDRLQHAAEHAVRAGAVIIVLTDRGVEPRTLLPALLALARCTITCSRCGLRARVDLVVESGEPREVHHLACLVGYGAAAVNPYLALARHATGRWRARASRSPGAGAS